MPQKASTEIQVDWTAGISEHLAKWRDDIQDQMLGTALKGVQPKWYTRSWVYQELGNARRVLWCFGAVHREKTAPALSLRFASRRLLYGTLLPAVEAFSSALDQIAPASTGRSLRTLSLTNYVGKTRMLVSSDPKDRLYSLLSVTADREAQLIRPDYYRPCWRVFAEATYDSIAGSGSLDI